VATGGHSGHGLSLVAKGDDLLDGSPRSPGHRVPGDKRFKGNRSQDTHIHDQGFETVVLNSIREVADLFSPGIQRTDNDDFFS